MKLSEKIIKKNKRNIEEAEARLKKSKKELDRACERSKLASHVIGNIDRLKSMSDSDIRKRYLPRILASDCNKTLLEHCVGPGVVIHYDVSERFDAFRDWLVEKHDSIYYVENLGYMGIMSARYLKEGCIKSEFDDGVWETLKDWIQLYNSRQMNEELYRAVMEDDFESLYDRSTK